MTRTTFNTWEYEKEHRHSPKGRGGWLFCKVDDYDRRTGQPKSWDLMLSANGTYTDAKRQIARQLSPNGCEVIVLP